MRLHADARSRVSGSICVLLPHAEKGKHTLLLPRSSALSITQLPLGRSLDVEQNFVPFFDIMVESISFEIWLTGFKSCFYSLNVMPLPSEV